MRRVWVVLELLFAAGIALLALAAWWDPFLALLEMLWSRVNIAGFMRSALTQEGGPGAGGIGSVSAGYSELIVAGILFVSPSLLLWRAHAWMAAANIGGLAVRRLARIHKWIATVAPIVFLIPLLIAVVLMNSMGQERGSLWLFALFFIPSLVLNPGVFVAVAGGQAASAIAGLAFFFRR